MDNLPSWATRLIVATGVTFGEITMLVIYGVAFEGLVRMLGSRWYPLLDDGGSILISVVAPSLAFWIIRAFRSDARRMSWLLVAPVVLTNLAVAWVMEAFPADIAHKWPRWAFLVGTIAALFSGALCGTFLRAGHVTFGRGKEPARGIRIS